jgi:L-lactate dehydrogenase complex protein LldG
MSARDQILGHVRRALVGAYPPAAVPRDYRTTPDGDRAEIVSRFADRVVDYRAVVVRCAPDEVEARIAEALPPGARVVVPDGFALSVPGAVRDDALTAGELDRLDAVVTTATAGIAETGTVVLTHGPGEGRRAISLLPDLHLCVLREDQVVSDVPDVMALLDPTRPTTWISGPSATSDIELQRVEGVHGPRTLIVILVATRGLP